MNVGLPQSQVFALSISQFARAPDSCVDESMDAKSFRPCERGFKFNCTGPWSHAVGDNERQQRWVSSLEFGWRYSALWGLRI